MRDDLEKLRSDLELAIRALQGIEESRNLHDAQVQAKVALELLAHGLGEAPPPPERETGTVKGFDRSKGYGFIVRDRGSSDIFGHSNDLRNQHYPWLSGAAGRVYGGPGAERASGSRCGGDRLKMESKRGLLAPFFS